MAPRGGGNRRRFSLTVLAIVGALAVGAGGCAATLPVSEHEAIRDRDRLQYEELLAEARRRQSRAESAQTRCQTAAQSVETGTARRVERLEGQLRRKEARLRRAEARAARCGDRPGRTRRPEGRTARRDEPRNWAGSWAPLSLKVRPSAEEGMVHLVLNSDELFREGAVTLEASAGPSIERLAGLLLRAQRVIVAVHADPEANGEARTGADGWALTAARAQGLARALQRSGLDPSRLVLQFHGGHHPRVDGDSTGPHRRIEIQAFGLP